MVRTSSASSLGPSSVQRASCVSEVRNFAITGFSSSLTWRSSNPLKRWPKRPRRNRYSVRTDSGPIALRAFWSMHVEAMNWSGMGHAEYAAALGLSPHALRIWRDRLEESGNEMDWRSLLHPSARGSIKQRC